MTLTSLFETLRGRLEQIWQCDVILTVSELWTSLIPALRELFQIGKNQLALVSRGEINVIVITESYQ